MAKNDELDVVISDPRISDDEWAAFGKILGIEDILSISWHKRQELVNKEIRHYYGHAFVNPFRTAYEPNYVDPILVEVAKKLEVPVSNHRVEDIEDQVIIKVIQSAREQIIKEKGQAAWDEIEKDIQREVEELIRLGKIPQSVADELIKLRGVALVVALIGGNLAGFSLFIVATKTFFSISRFLGLGIGVAVAGPIIGGALSFLLGPAGWVLAGLTIAFDLGDTNWKKVIPAVVMVAVIRKRLAFCTLGVGI